MSELSSVHHFSFGSPEYLLGLLIVPLVLGFALIVRRRRSRYSVRFTSLDVLASVVEKRRRPHWRQGVPLLLLVLAVSLAEAVLARPHARVFTSDRNTTIILLVDVSGSMQAADVIPTRMSAAVDSMKIFLDKLPSGDKVGLIAFSDRTEVVDAPTSNHAAIADGLDTLSPEAGTALGDGVAAAVKLAVSSLAASGVHRVGNEFLPAAIVLESDGAQNRGLITPYAAATLARKSGIRIFGVALGTPGGVVTEGNGLLQATIPVPPDPGAVALLAHETGGQAFLATDAQSLDNIYRSLGSRVVRRTEVKDIASWFELAAAVLLVGGVGVARAWGASLP